MARFVRLWGKKRGHRLSGWWVLGSAGEALFFVCLFAMGILVLSLLIAWQVLSPATQVYRVGFGFWLLITAASTFVIIGGSGFFYRVWQLWASDERRSAFARKASSLDLVGGPKRNGELAASPSLPDLKAMTDSPGVRLTYRLPSVQNALAPLLFGSLFTLSWNGMVAMLTAVAVSAHLQGQPRWFLTILLVPFGTIGVLSARWFFRLFRQHTGVGSTSVEVDELPLYPGRSYQLCVVQHGHLVLKRIQAWLVCEEEATFHQGTDIRSERQIVYRQNVLEQGRCRVEPGRPLELRADFRLPEDAMHSFHSSHNAIHWKVVVEGEAKQWPSFCRSFPVVVYPIVRRRPVESSLS